MNRINRAGMVTRRLLLAATVGFALIGMIEAEARDDVRRPFSLVDEDGNAVTDQEMRGRYALIYFGFTHCADVCPTDLAVVAQAINSLGDMETKVTPVFVSIDPDRDPPSRLKAWTSAFHPRMIGLTGDKKVLKRLANSYGADFVVRKSDGDVYYVWHTNNKYLVGPDGQLLKTFQSSASANEIAGEIKRHLE